MTEMAELLARHYGLELLLLQNDLTEQVVIQMLIDNGLVDTEDYLFQDVSQERLDLED